MDHLKAEVCQEITSTAQLTFQRCWVEDPDQSETFKLKHSTPVVARVCFLWCDVEMWDSLSIWVYKVALPCLVHHSNAIVL